MTDRKNGYGFTLQLNTEYRIEISKEGFLKEVLYIFTHVPQEVILYGDDLLWEPDIYLYKILPGLNMDEFKMPVAYYVFNLELWSIIEDEEYRTEVEPMILEVSQKIDRLKDKAYQEKKNRGDSLSRAERYEEAIIAYKEAEQYNSEENQLKAQIKSVKKLLRTRYTDEEENIDQIGDKILKRFMVSQFRETLLKALNKPMEEQKGHLEKTLNSWKGKLEQTDDILLMGLRI